MSEQDHFSFFLETHSWAFSNSDNSGGSDEKSTKKPPESSSNNSPMATPIVSQKRTRNGIPKKNKEREWNESKGGESDHEIHIWTERERRKKMRNMFSNLHALLPHLPAKADKSTIVDEAVSYIKTLQHSLQKLQKQKLEMIRGATNDNKGSTNDSREAFLADQGASKSWDLMNPSSVASMVPQFPYYGFQTWSSPNVILSICGDEAHISICTAKKPGLSPTIFYILEKHKLDVITTNISSDYFRSMYMIHARASEVSNQFSETFVVEEIYKLAVGEIIFWLST
ncbi:transcription factor bHLH95-like [Tasmannia lanceolata]|uniref:transcription factor bHLH95-like n=1 Tax=Tasmannia lanceolata TaxID=3420 RepID=UPI00406373C2